MFTGGGASFFLCLGLLAVCFFLGIVWGHVSARKNADATGIELHRYLAEYYVMDHADAGSGVVFLSAILVYFRYPVIAFFLGFTVFGALLLPGVSVIFGFFLSFAACCFAGAFGERGVLLALAVLGFRCLVTLPCFFVLATPAFKRAIWKLREYFLHRGKSVQKPFLCLERGLTICMIAAMLLVGALAEVFLSPVLLEAVLQNIQI